VKVRILGAPVSPLLRAVRGLGARHIELQGEETLDSKIVARWDGVIVTGLHRVIGAHIHPEDLLVLRQQRPVPERAAG